MNRDIYKKVLANKRICVTKVEKARDVNNCLDSHIKSVNEINALTYTYVLLSIKKSHRYIATAKINVR
jgi:hypothetical protein